MTAASTVVVATATAVVTNLVTDKWSMTLIAALVALVLVGIALAIRSAAGKGLLTAVRQRVGPGSSVTESGIKASRGADVDDRTGKTGAIRRSRIEAKGAKVRRRNRGGVIEDSPIDASQ